MHGTTDPRNNMRSYRISNAIGWLRFIRSLNTVTSMAVLGRFSRANLLESFGEKSVGRDDRSISRANLRASCV
jgi:hypothetical protein